MIISDYAARPVSTDGPWQTLRTEVFSSVKVEGASFNIFSPAKLTGQTALLLSLTEEIESLTRTSELADIYKCENIEKQHGMNVYLV